MRTHPTILAVLLPCLLAAQAPTRIILRLAHDVPLKARPIMDRTLIGAEPIDRVSAAFHATGAWRMTALKPGLPHLYVIEFPTGTVAAPVMEAYRNTGMVARVEADHMGYGGGDRSFVPNDTYYFRQWGLHNDGSFSLHASTAGADIDMEGAWEIEQGSEDVTVAIIDSGVRMQHPDFGDRIWQNTGEVAGNGIDDDGNGLIDDVRGWDFANEDNDPSDDQGHGTNVTSIVGAAGNNGTGFAGVDLNCKVMVIKGLNSANQGWYSWWIAGMYYAVDNGADVISMSMGGTDPSPEMQDAVDHALANGVTVVACMMNTNSNTPFIPASLNGVMAVGATSSNDRRAVPFYWSATSGSNYGSHISVCAPGDYIYGLHYNSDAVFSGYWSGTSQATPHVAALAGLLKAQLPSRTPAQIRAIIENTAEDQVGDPLEDTPGWDPYHGHGRINAYQALMQAVSTGEVAPPPAGISVFPNPSAGMTCVRTTRSGEAAVFDAMGRMVHAQRVGTGTTVMNATFAPGTYLVRFTAEGTVLTQRLAVE